MTTAVRQESTGASERAAASESAVEGERAGDAESAVIRERADVLESTATEERPEPPRRTRCAAPGCKRKPVTKPKRSTYGSERDYAEDPFCSRLCCERYYGMTVAADRPNHR